MQSRQMQHHQHQKSQWNGNHMQRKKPVECSVGQEIVTTYPFGQRLTNTGNGANQNQGAESTLSFLNSLLAIQGQRRLTASAPQVVAMDFKRRRQGHSDAA
jgi:hypothetical protein